MFIRINCKQNDKGCWCKDKRIKRSLLGIGARMCCEAEGKMCAIKDSYQKPQLASIMHNTVREVFQ